MTYTDAVIRGRERIAQLAKANGETMFAREVLAGCWDHRSDIQRAIEVEALNDQK